MILSMPANYDFACNPNFRASLNYVGESRQPVLIVDDVLRDPNSLTEFAANDATFRAAWTRMGGYPGVRSDAPREYVKELLTHLGGMIEKAFFSPEPVAPVDANCLLSMVTRRPQQLTNQQRIPHFDTPDPMRIAVLHYLGDESFGGTAFYRHRKTGLDAVPPHLEAEFCRIRDEELKLSPPPAGFVTANAENFEQTTAVDARFNRLIVYRSQHLHSGSIPADMNFSTDPRKGRLTATIFITYRYV
jgi:hypothetical protein